MRTTAHLISSQIHPIYLSISSDLTTQHLPLRQTDTHTELLTRTNAERTDSDDAERRLKSCVKGKERKGKERKGEERKGKESLDSLSPRWDQVLGFVPGDDFFESRFRAWSKGVELVRLPALPLSIE